MTWDYLLLGYLTFIVIAFAYTLFSFLAKAILRDVPVAALAKSFCRAIVKLFLVMLLALTFPIWIIPWFLYKETHHEGKD